MIPIQVMIYYSKSILGNIFSNIVNMLSSCSPDFLCTMCIVFWQCTVHRVQCVQHGVCTQLQLLISMRNKDTILGSEWVHFVQKVYFVMVKKHPLNAMLHTILLGNYVNCGILTPCNEFLLSVCCRFINTILMFAVVLSTRYYCLL